MHSQIQRCNAEVVDVEGKTNMLLAVFRDLRVALTAKLEAHQEQVPCVWAMGVGAGAGAGAGTGTASGVMGWVPPSPLTPLPHAQRTPPPPHPLPCSDAILCS